MISHELSTIDGFEGNIMYKTSIIRMIKSPNKLDPRALNVARANTPPLSARHSWLHTTKQL